MRFVDLSLTDLGVYRNARLDGIEAGMNVVAGPQRAGKTTFMQAVRQLPFGVRGTELPPATNTYELAATVGHEGEKYALRVSGQGAPRIDPLDGDEAPEITLGELVGGLTRAQYRQLCTISLRELRRLPEGVESEADLSEVLLGAAYGDISHVPALRDEFARDAYAIGAKYGRKNVSALGTATERIERAVTKREEATRTVAEHDVKQGDLAEVNRRLGAIDDREATLEAERTRLSLLDKWFDELGTYRETRAELGGLSEPADEYPTEAVESARTLEMELQEAIEERAAARADLATHADQDVVADNGTEILERASKIVSYDRRIEKWRSQETAIAEEKVEVASTRRDLERRVQKLRADWDALGAVRQVTADELTRERVRDVTTRVESLREERAGTKRACDTKRSELATLESDLERAEAAGEGRTPTAGSQQAPLVGAGIALCGLVIGAVLGTFLSPVVGYPVAAIGIGAGFYYTRTRIENDASGGEPVRELKATIANRRATIDGLERTLEAVEERLADAEAELDGLRDRFDLPENCSPKAVRDCYDGFVSLRGDIRSYDDRREAHEAERRSFEEELRSVAESIAPLCEFGRDGWDDEADRDERALRERSDELFDAVETAMAAVQAARRLDEANRAVEDVRSEVRALLVNWGSDPNRGPADGDDRGSAAAGLDGTEPDEEGVADRRASLRAYADAAASAQEYEALRAEMETIESRIESDFRRSATIEAFAPIVAAVGTDGGTTQGANETEETEETEENGPEDPAEKSIPALERLADRYATRAEIDARLEDIERELTDLNAEREELRTRRAKVAEHLTTLASDEDLRAAQAEIQRGRERLWALGEEYATDRLAEALLDRLHDRFIEEATGPLLDEASEIFSRITETYDGVTHTGELDALAFEARRRGTSNLETAALSRATAEQLFLSVRLARIRTVEASVPIVVDDAMTNFDPAHTRRTLSFLDDLARTNQVLLLTCHPEIVRLAGEVADVGGYWCLDEGRFDGPVNDPTEVCAFLNAE